MTLRVLHLSAGNLYGGIERLLTTLALERACCEQMEPSFGLCFDGKVAAELRSEGVPVHLLGDVRFSRPWTMWRARRGLRNLLRRERYDVAICHACWPHALFGSVIRDVGVPLVFWAHDIPRMVHWSERKAAKVHPDLVLANSKYTAERLPTLFPAVKTEVCYAPVSLGSAHLSPTIREDVRRELETDSADVAIVMFARMEEWKGHDLLLAALRKLNDLPGWTCWIAGGAQRPSEHQYLDRLRNLASESPVSGRIRFLGQRSDIPRLLAAADIHCQPNMGPEPFGLAFIEALAAGLPLVTTEIGAAAEIVTPACGRLVPPADPSALARALRELVTGVKSDSQLSDACRNRAAELCAPASQILQLMRLFRGLAGSRATSGGQ
ncbi:glycosyltransferase [Humisphaera borealis]|uniref:Glycosyltransferase n=2 Tax=Humisphaera borealis TaxID=2807512 RepID=A0A7M2WYU5_9BACT|nr:glycosyltransferase [Humisphaera borealis]